MESEAGAHEQSDASHSGGGPFALPAGARDLPVFNDAPEDDLATLMTVLGLQNLLGLGTSLPQTSMPRTAETGPTSMRVDLCAKGGASF